MSVENSRLEGGQYEGTKSLHVASQKDEFGVSRHERVSNRRIQLLRVVVRSR
jgi:hypothetical protein